MKIQHKIRARNDDFTMNDAGFNFKIYKLNIEDIKNLIMQNPEICNLAKLKY